MHRMNDEFKALALRAVACDGWRWMQGMRIVDRPDATDGTTYSRIAVVGTHPHVEGAHIRANYEHALTPHIGPPWGLPDLTDPATLGCLRELVREAWSGVSADGRCPAAFQFDGRWGVGGMEGKAMAAIVLPACDTEAEALVAALEAAPKREG